MSDLVSILIPSYNAEKWIRETIQSALSQTWAKKEIIVVDDGSTDNTLQIIKKYEANSVKIISQENMGAPAARNKAYEWAQGNYFQWLDADDLLSPDKIEKQMREMKMIGDPMVLLTSSWATFYYRPQNAKFIPNNLCRNFSPVEWLMTKLGENLWMNPATWLVSRRLAELAGPWDERLVRDQDGEYLCRIVTQSKGIEFISEGRCYYRLCNPKSISRADPGVVSESLFLSTRLCIGYLRSIEDSERTRSACLKFLQKRLIYFYPDKDKILREANDLAKSLGGELFKPEVNWKYKAVRKIVGSEIAKRMQHVVRVVKWSAIVNWDRLIFKLLGD